MIIIEGPKDLQELSDKLGRLAELEDEREKTFKILKQICELFGYPHFDNYQIEQKLEHLKNYEILDMCIMPSIKEMLEI